MNDSAEKHDSDFYEMLPVMAIYTAEQLPNWNVRARALNDPRIGALIDLRIHCPRDERSRAQVRQLLQEIIEGLDDCFEKYDQLCAADDWKRRRVPELVAK